MPEEIMNQTTPTPEEVLVQMSENMVPKTDYDDMVEKYNKLFKDVATGRLFDKPVEVSPEEMQKKAEDQIIAMRNGKSKGMLANMQMLIDLDDAKTAKGERSIFYGEDSTDAECEELDNIKEAFKFIIENSNGDDRVASAMLGNILTK